MKNYTISYLKEILHDLKLVGFDRLCFNNVKPLSEADEFSIIWIKPGRNDKDEIVQNTKAKIIVIGDDYQPDQKTLGKKCFILTENPKLTFIRIVKQFFVKKPDTGIHPSATVHKSAKIGNGCYIGPNSYIGNAIIGDGTIIHGNCFIYDDVIIGNNVAVNAGTVIGSVGYGYARNEKGEFEGFPHVGGVLIEDNVDIGANTCIDRGALGNTIIKEGAKIDNLVHVAHNVIIGRHSAIIANSMLGGSVEIGDYSWVAPSASILNQIIIGNNATVGMSAVVTKNVDNNITVAGLPARPLNDFIKIQKYLKSI